MDPITITSVSLYVAIKFLDQFLIDEGYNRIKRFLFPKKKYKNRLAQIIHQTVLEFEVSFPNNANDGKIPFYHSQIVFEKLMTVMLKTKLTNEFKFELTKNSNIKAPTQEELNFFLDLFSAKIKSDKELTKLYIQDNYRSEIYEISSAINRMEEKMDRLLAITYDSNSLTIFMRESYLNDLNYPTDLLHNYKPKQALDYLLKFKNDKWIDSEDIVKYKVTANIGQCYMQLHNDEEASKFFIEAEQYSPDLPKAIGFVALGYAMSNNIDEFTRVYDKALRLGDVNELVYLSIITMDKFKSTVDSLLENIPIDMHNNTQVAFALGRHLKQQGKLEDCEHWMEIAIKNDTQGRLELKGLLGCYILELVCTPFVYITKQIDDMAKLKIEKAINLLTQAWEGVRDNDLRNSIYYMLLNRGIGKRFLGDFEGGYCDIKEASKYNNEFITMRHLALASWDSGKTTEAITLLEDIINKDISFSKEHEIELLLANCYICTEHTAKAIPLLEGIIEGNQSEYGVNEARSMLIPILIKNNNLIEAKRLNTIVIEQLPENVIGYVNSAHIAHSDGDKEAVKLSLQDAQNRITERTSPYEIIDLGNVAFFYEEYEIVISCFENLVDKSVISALLKSLIQSYFNTDKYSKAIEICETLRLNGLYDPFFIDLEVRIQIKMSNAPKAIEICEEFIFRDSSNVFINARLAILYFHSMNFEKCEISLLRINNLNYLPLDYAFKIARLHIDIGLCIKGLNYMYSLWRNNLNSPDVHGYLASNSLLLPDEASDFMNEDIVKLDTAVSLIIGGKSVTYLIVEKDPNILLGELSASDIIAQKLIGKSIGDIIEINDDFGIYKEAEITRIISKFTFAQEKCMEFIQSLQMQKSGIKIFTAEGTTDDERSKNMMAFFDSLVEKNQAKTSKILEFYKSRALTINLFSLAKAKNIIDVWSSLINDDALGVHTNECCTGEYQDAQRLILDNEPIVLDFNSILSLDYINALREFDFISNKLYVSQAILDVFRDFLIENSNVGELGKITLGKNADGFVFHQLSRDQVSAQKNKIQLLVDWLVEKCEILPTIELDTDANQQVFHLAGDISAKSILLAKDQKALLLSDETCVRLIANNTLNAKGANVQMFLRALMEVGKISLEIYDSYCVKLISINYKGLMLHPSTLILAFKESNYSISNPFTQALNILHGQNSEENSAFYVSVLFLRDLYLKNEMPSSKNDVVTFLLNTLVEGRTIHNVELKMKEFVGKEFASNPIEKTELLNIIKDWSLNLVEL